MQQPPEAWGNTLFWGYLCLGGSFNLDSFGLGQAPVHPQPMELLLPIQKLLANLLFHRFNLMGKMRGRAVLQAHTEKYECFPPREGSKLTCSWCRMEEELPSE